MIFWPSFTMRTCCMPPQLTVMAVCGVGKEQGGRSMGLWASPVEQRGAAFSVHEVQAVSSKGYKSHDAQPVTTL
eukprot:CAMPEP_0178461342 /NCGR_PEP_ID=MMETSP0689_2-20121128/49256_1 /TAXON_ID=160604 /ORGANISM="Amphidinium massartii, Strain CS-259" /LENGTH=73 /DNA_ID=CAMNT_0020088167 /DNA_START=208 /DNA_END=426 /DNA_ORIENTATION=-